MKALPKDTYRERCRQGTVTRRPRKLSREKAAIIRRRYFAREATQLELALEFNVGQNTISRLVSGYIWA